MTTARRQLLGYGLGSAAAVASVLPVAKLLYPQVKDVTLPPPDLRGLTTPAAPAASAIASPHVAKSKLADDVRRAFVHNLHTDETLDAVYFENGAYVPGALRAAMKVLRDWRSGAEHFMDPRLFDLLHRLRDKMDVRGAFQIVSGYRSAATNAAMHARDKEVAARSQHVLGRALDISMQGVQLAHLHRAALALAVGGVGFYPQSGFVHVDVGPVRQWIGV